MRARLGRHAGDDPDVGLARRQRRGARRPDVRRDSRRAGSTRRRRRTGGGGSSRCSTNAADGDRPEPIRPLAVDHDRDRRRPRPIRRRRIDAYQAIAARHQHALGHLRNARQILFRSNYGLCRFEERDDGALEAVHEVYTAFTDPDRPDPRRARSRRPYLVQRASLGPLDEDPPDPACGASVIEIPAVAERDRPSSSSPARSVDVLGVRHRPRSARTSPATPSSGTSAANADVDPGTPDVPAGAARVDQGLPGRRRPGRRGRHRRARRHRPPARRHRRQRRGVGPRRQPRIARPARPVAARPDRPATTSGCAFPRTFLCLQAAGRAHRGHDDLRRRLEQPATACGRRSRRSGCSSPTPARRWPTCSRGAGPRPGDPDRYRADQVAVTTCSFRLGGGDARLRSTATTRSTSPATSSPAGTGPASTSTSGRAPTRRRHPLEPAGVVLAGHGVGATTTTTSSWPSRSC